jgi:hypothetical protein
VRAGGQKIAFWLLAAPAGSRLLLGCRPGCALLCTGAGSRAMLPSRLDGYLRRVGRWTLVVTCRLVFSGRRWVNRCDKLALPDTVEGAAVFALGTPRSQHSDGGLSKWSLRRTEQGTGALGERDGPPTRTPPAAVLLQALFLFGVADGVCGLLLGRAAVFWRFSVEPEQGGRPPFRPFSRHCIPYLLRS